jgi:hypothetical protein
VPGCFSGKAWTSLTVVTVDDGVRLGAQEAAIGSGSYTCTLTVHHRLVHWLRRGAVLGCSRHALTHCTSSLFERGGHNSSMTRILLVHWLRRGAVLGCSRHALTHCTCTGSAADVSSRPGTTTGKDDAGLAQLRHYD